MRHASTLASMVLLTTSLSVHNSLGAADIIPAAGAIKKDRPRLLLRPGNAPYAISLAQLKAIHRAFRKLFHRRRPAAVSSLAHETTGYQGDAKIGPTTR